jgi:methyltransferase (TIGR00027 family)
MTAVLHPRWDPAERIGTEALSGSAFRALAARLHPGMFDDPFACRFVRGSSALRRVARGEIDPAVDDVRQWFADSAFVASRTRYFDDFVCDAIDHGVRQVVLLGSGLDSRAHRLDLPADTVVFDVDEPAVIAVKNAMTARLRIGTPARYRPVGVDLTAGWGTLRRGWPVALERAGFDAGRSSAWVAESVLHRLSAGGQQRLVRTVTAHSTGHSLFAADYLDAADVTRALLDDEAGVRTWQSLGILGDLVDLPPTGSGPGVPRLLSRLAWSSTAVSSADLLQHYGLTDYSYPTSITRRIRFLAAAR